MIEDQGPAGRGAVGVVLFGWFLAAAAVVAAFAAASIVWPHGLLAAMWAAKASAYATLRHMKAVAGPALVVVAVALGASALGWSRRRGWAWGVAVGVLALNLAGDLATAVLARQWAQLAGGVVEGALLVWLLSRPVRSQFR